VSRNSLSYFITFGCLSLLVSGCGGDAPKPSNSASPSPAVSAAVPAPVAAIPSVTPQPIVAKTLDGKPVAAGASFSGDIAAGLIPASDVELATKAVSKGRVDPFSSVIAVTFRPSAPQPRVQPAATSTLVAPIATTPVKTGSNLGAASIASMMAKKKSIGNGAIVAKNISGIKGKAASSLDPVGSVAATMPLVPTKQPATPVTTALLTPPVAPAVIQPELAKAIQVSGVSEINGQIQVVVKLPGESFSRYISVGEKVLNGKVLIKRVQDRNAITPIVVLEEAGTEVFRKVGDKPLVAVKDAPEPAK
jgi:hypothetical protein